MILLYQVMTSLNICTVCMYEQDTKDPFADSARAPRYYNQLDPVCLGVHHLPPIVINNLFYMCVRMYVCVRT